MKVLKFSSETCGVCGRMRPIETAVANELEIELLEIKMQDAKLYREYRSILLEAFPGKEGMGWPTYIVVDETNDNEILGTIVGGKPKPQLKREIVACIPDSEE